MTKPAKTYHARTINFGNARKPEWGTRITTFENGKVVKTERIAGIHNRRAADAATSAWNLRFINEGTLA